MVMPHVALYIREAMFRWEGILVQRGESLYAKEMSWQGGWWGGGINEVSASPCEHA
jgi:hypothetical protein